MDQARPTRKLLDLRSYPDRSSRHIQTDSNDIRPHIVQTHKERTSTKSNLVTAQITPHESPEDGRKYGPKHVRATPLKCF